MEGQRNDIIRLDRALDFDIGQVSEGLVAATNSVFSPIFFAANECIAQILEKFRVYRKVCSYWWVFKVQQCEYYFVKKASECLLLKGGVNLSYFRSLSRSLRRSSINRSGFQLFLTIAGLPVYLSWSEIISNGCQCLVIREFFV
jgi:hypothetical protein